MKRATIQGFLVFDFAEKYRPALKELGGWVADGSLKYRETLVPGFENMPKAFIGLFEGSNIGKQLIQVSQS